MPTLSAITEIEQFQNDAIDLYGEAAELLVSKQIDYGPDNIQKSPVGPHNGLIVRIFDKLSRAGNLVNNDINPNHESLRDTFIDIMNYGAIGVMLIDETFPTATEE